MVEAIGNFGIALLRLVLVVVMAYGLFGLYAMALVSMTPIKPENANMRLIGLINVMAVWVAAIGLAVCVMALK